VLGEPAHPFAGAGAAAGAGGSGSAVGLRSLGRHFLACGTDVADHGVDRDGEAFADINLQEEAFEETFDLQVGLVGLDLKQNVAFRDRIALFFEPFDNSSLLHGLTEFRKNDCLSHSISR
jgi:hypothetical protein